MIKLFKIFILLFSIISLFAYIISDLIGIDNKIINLLFVVILFLSGIFFISFDPYIPKFRKSSAVLFFLFIYLFTFSISLIRNGVTEWLPSFLKFGSYLLFFMLTYKYTVRQRINQHFVTIVCILMLLVTSFSGLHEILSGKVNFVNGAFRVHGNFKSHLGFALMLFVTLNYLLNVEILGSKSFNKKIGYILVFLFGLYMMNASHSRMLTASIFIVNLLAFVFFSDNFKRKISMFFVSVILIVGAYYLVLSTDLFPRIREGLVTDQIDPSTLYRIFIITETFNAMTTLDYLIGIGLGGFNMFFYNATGEIGVAAHNDYLLWLVEGGVLILLLYLIFQSKFIFNINYYRKKLKGNNEIKRLAFATFVLFVGVEIFGFLLNPHYFYQVELFMMIVFGYFFGRCKVELEK